MTSAIPKLPLSSYPAAIARAYNLILGSPYCQTTGGQEILADLQAMESGLKVLAAYEDQIREAIRQEKARAV